MQKVQRLRGIKKHITHAAVHTLTVREVKVMHMPPKPLKVKAMKIRTESSANDTCESVMNQTTVQFLIQCNKVHVCTLQAYLPSGL